MGVVVVLNGGSSSGKTAIARTVVHLLPDGWLRLSIDDFVDSLPSRLLDDESGLVIGSDGTVSAGPVFRDLGRAWMTGVAGMAAAGANVVLDDAFLRGRESQLRTEHSLANVETLWVGVHCDPDVAERREIARGDRVLGMARRQAHQVHRGVRYDIEVDNGSTDAFECAQRIVALIAERAPSAAGPS